MNIRSASPAILLGALLAGCGSEEAVESDYEVLAPRQQLIRLSMDLRGTHPTENELRQFEGAEFPDQVYDQFADAWIQEPAFLDRMVEVFDQKFLFRTGDVYFDQGEVGLNVPDEVMAEMIANEPLMLLKYTIANDLPYSYVVTADHSMANPELALYWGMDYDEEAAGSWAPAQYFDGRPHAGMLTMSTMWQRYPSMGGNANRHRANAISKMFLCDDYLSRPIVLNRAAVDQLTVDPENAINQTQSCQSCHSTLDPIAANFFGFFNYDEEEGIDQTFYRPENEEMWRDYAGREPGYYGRPTANIPEFAAELAQDSRFLDCAVQTVWEGLNQRPMVDGDWANMSAHRSAFETSDMNVKELVRSIVTSDEYRASAARDPELNDRLAGLRTASPSQLGQVIADKTGYRWWFDGRYVTNRGYIPSVGTAFVMERVAQSAGYYVAQHDLDPAREGSAQLLVYVTVEDDPDTNRDAFVQQIRHLYLEITGLPLAEDATEPDELIDTWKYIHSVQASPTLAWAGVISAILRDPRVLFY